MGFARCRPIRASRHPCRLRGCGRLLRADRWIGAGEAVRARPIRSSAMRPVPLPGLCTKLSWNIPLIIKVYHTENSVQFGAVSRRTGAGDSAREQGARSCGIRISEFGIRGGFRRAALAALASGIRPSRPANPESRNPIDPARALAGMGFARCRPIRASRHPCRLRGCGRLLRTDRRIGAGERGGCALLPKGRD